MNITITKELKMKCIKCEYEWTARIKNPKECPECKTRLNRVKYGG